MTKEKLSQSSLEELKSRESMLAKAAPLYMISILVMVIAGSYLTSKNGFNTFTIVPLVFILAYISNANILKRIREEITGRQK